MPLKMCDYWLLIFLCNLLKCCQGLQNGATELSDATKTSFIQETTNNASLNHARSGGRHDNSKAQLVQSQMSCRELRSTKYISDGHCTSVKAVKELVCVGECVPAHLLPNWIGGGYWARKNVTEWRCVTESTHTQRVRLRCRDGSMRTYKVTVVTSCTCKRLTREHNKSAKKPLLRNAKRNKRPSV